MNKRIILILIISLLITSCAKENMNISETISLPKISKSPLEGIWQSSNKREIKEDNIEETDLGQLKNAYFYKDYYFLNGKYNKEVNYVAKNLDAKTYLPSRYSNEQIKEVIKGDKINVISIYKDGKLQDELILLAEDEMVLRDGDSFLYYKKIKDEISEEEIKKIIKNEEEIIDSEKNIDLGLLLGIKEEIYTGVYAYKSIYISVIDGKVKYFNLDDIAIPFRNGFYKLEVLRLADRDELILTDYDEMKEKSLDSKTFKNISFIGNYHISYESSEENKNWLGLYQLNHLENESRIKLDSVTNKNDLKRLRFYTRNKEDFIIDEYNFGLIRNSGDWKLVNREIKEEDEKQYYNDYEMNMTIPESILKNFNSTNQFANLIEKYPDIEDIFTSPNRELILVQWPNKWVLYRYKDSKLKDILLTIEKKENQSVIMEQWATEGYVKYWEQELKDILLNDKYNHKIKK